MAFSKRDVKDRVVQHPKRYRFVPVTGQADTYDLVPVTGTVIEAGTPINKAYLQPIEDALGDAHLDLQNKVDKITGKGLSTNDYTTGEKNKLAGLPTDVVNAISVSPINSDPDTTQIPYILTNHANSPGGGAYWHVQTLFYSSKTGNRAQIAVRYNGGTDEMYIRSLYSSTWTTWKRVYHDSNLTKTLIDLGNVQNYGIATKAEAETGTSNSKYITPLRLTEAIIARESSLGIARVATGTYTGNGTNDRLIAVGFKPTLVIITPVAGSTSQTIAVPSVAYSHSPGTSSKHIPNDENTKITSNGFTVSNRSTGLHANDSGDVFEWVAIG